MRTLWPVLERELRVAARRPQTWRMRLATSGTAMFFLVAVTMFFERSGMKGTPGQAGAAVFATIGMLAGIWALFIGCQQTADSLGRERREGTLGLLFLTDLKGRDVVMGKLFASGLDTVFHLVGMAPVLAVPLLLGGVSLGQLGLLMLALANGLFLSLTAGLMASLLARDARQASGLAMSWLLGLLFLPWGLFAFLTNHGEDPMSAGEAAWVLMFSPSLPFLAASSGLPNDLPREAMVGAVGLQALLGWMLLGLASRWVRVVWQEGGGPGWRTRLEVWKSWLRYGGAQRRLAWRRHWLEQGAWDWLSLREVWKPWLPWVLVAGWLMVLGVTIVQLKLDTALGISSGVLSVVFHGLFALWIAGEAAMTLSEQHSGGAMELLLTTGLTQSEMLEGQGRVLWRVLGWPLGVLMGVDVVVCAMLVLGNWQWSEVAVGWWLHLTVLVLAPLQWHALRWAATHAALKGRALNVSVGIAMNAVILLPALLSYGVFGSMAILLGLGSRISLSASLWLAMGVPLMLQAGWCLVWGWRQSQRTRISFRSQALKRRKETES